MKNNLKSIIVLVLIATVLFCVGCKGNSEVTEEQLPAEPLENQFDAEVLEVQDEYLMVEALEGQTVAGEVKVWIGLLSEDEMIKKFLNLRKVSEVAWAACRKLAEL